MVEGCASNRNFSNVITVVLLSLLFLQACHALSMWLLNNEEYSSLTPVQHLNIQDSLRFTSSFMSQQEHEDVSRLFISAARQKHADNIDPDVQVNSETMEHC